MRALAVAWLAGCGGFGADEAGYVGTIEVTEVELAPTVPGRLLEVRFEEGERVAAGEVAFVVEADALQAERDVRAAGVGVAEAAIEVARAQVRAAEAQVATLEREAERVRRMQGGGVGSAQQVSTLEGQLAVARAQAATARRGVAQAEAARGQAAAGLSAAEDRVADAEVRAVGGGVVLSRNREPGEVVGAGMSVLTLGDLDRPRLRVYAPLLVVETLSVGDPVPVRLDARPDEVITGRVARVASEAEFTPRDILTPEERVKRVFAVDIALDPAPGLLPGVPAAAELGG